MDTKAFLTLKQIVSSYLNEKGIYTKENVMRYLILVKEGYTEINIYNTSFFTTYKTVVNVANMIYMPDDMIDYLRILVIENGELWELGRNDDIAFSTLGTCLIDVAEQSNLNATRDIPAFGYGVSGGYNVGNYRVDKHARTITFEGYMVNKDVIIEYSSSGVSMSAETYVPVALSPVLKNYIDKIVAVRDDTMPEYKVKSKEVRFSHSLRKYVRQEKMPTPQELMDVFRSAYALSPKR